MLHLCCFSGTFSDCGDQGKVFIAVHGLLIVVASLVENRLWGVQASVGVGHGLGSCSTQA